MLKTVTVDIDNIEWELPELDDCDWHCDNCNALLNNQDGFDAYCGTWECSECGCENHIDKEQIIGDYPSSIGGLVFMVTSKSDLEEQIRDYLNSSFDGYVEHFDYNTDEPIEEDEEDNDFANADICRGGDLSED